MTWIVEFTARLIRAGKRAYARKWSFLGVFAVVFLGSVVALARLDLLPDVPPTPVDPTVTLAASSPAAADTNGSASKIEPEFPTSIAIPAIKLSVKISNPDTTNVDALDQLLLKGAVRYPTSAKLGEMGNVVLFGHSSYLPIVGDEAYKTFDGIQKLAAGDTVTVYSSDRAYTYQVRSVAKESANDAAIQLSVSGNVLTLVTCNSFATKSDRFVVTADFVESHSISS
ncbi:MAG: sortase [Minisyncoccota bacterium]